VKICPVCKVDKPETEYQWRNKAKQWLNWACHPCRKAQVRDAQARRTPGEKAAYKRAWRAKDPNWHAKDYAKNKDREKAGRLAARLADPAGYLRKCAAHYVKHKASMNAAAKRWRFANADHDRAYNRRWYEENKAHVFEKSRRRRALVLDRTIVPFTLAELEAHVLSFACQCVYCGLAYEELDHVIPLSRGGEHSLANIRPACRSCNRRKHAKTPDEWAASLTTK